MAQQKKGLIARMLEGKEKSEEYARSTLPTNRWQLFWDIFKGSFSKLVKVNLLITLFFVPVLAILIFGGLMEDSNGVMYPFGANLAIGYPARPNLVGLSESLAIQSDLMIYGLICVACLIAAVGLSGGMYVIRNMVWTEGIFVANDFWRGVKLNFWNALQAALFFSIILLLSKFLINTAEFSLAVQDLSKAERIWFKISQGFSYVLIVLAAFMAFWMIALGVNYKQSFFVLFKNSFLMTIGMLPQTVFFVAIGLLPVWLIMIGGGEMNNIFTMIGSLVLVLFGFSFILLVWLDFAQWAFDKFINPKIEGAKVGRGIYNRDANAEDGDESGAVQEYRKALLASGRSRLVSRPIKPIDDSLQIYELPAAFTREDLQRLRESKQNIAEDTENYAEEHKNDKKYVDYNKEFDELEREQAEAEQQKGKKKKRKQPKIADVENTTDENP